MAKIVENKTAIDIMYQDVLCNGFYEEIEDLYKWITENEKEIELENIVNSEFPKGADVRTYRDFFLKKHSEIKTQLTKEK